MGWFAFDKGERVPGLTWVNLGIHEFGHLATYGFSDLTTAMMGSIAQVGVPLALAVYFLVFRGDWLAAGVCLAWAATSALEVSVYVADAPTQDLPLLGGGRHDWAFILGPDGYGALDRARPIADTIRDGASVAIYAGFALCVAAASRAIAAPSAAAASLTSGSAPRSASSPKWTPPS